MANVERLIGDAVGPSEEIDKEIGLIFDGRQAGEKPVAYTGSVDECIRLLSRLLPEWHWHVGHGPMGVVPYASMTRNSGEDGSVHMEASASTVPLALLGALIKALRYEN